MCGTIQEESRIVSSLNFVEDNGNSQLTGQMIRMSDTYNKVGKVFIASNNFYVRNTITSVCTSLGLRSDYSEAAFRWIGRVYMKISQLLNLKMPILDPSLYLPRFVSKLKLGNEALNLSMRIISRMKRDWIVVGRRPNNLCGAALVLSSRILKDERGISDVARVVHVSINTINKRLKEMGETESANLTLNDFNVVWLERECDPPILKINSLKIGTPPPSINDHLEEGVLTPEEDEMLHLPVDMKGIVTPSTSSRKEEDTFPLSLEEESELGEYILSRDEYEKKEILWDEMYGDYLKDKENRVTIPRKPQTKKRRKEFNTVEDALRSVVKEKSTKINYGLIENLFS
ncbi:transcription factor IIIB 60 kDa subunit-like [Nylanderia fulva]|uniref:transcription factor IIIB 60 kDa subunit-like n=1 Tax=Nylanderia fulva TaxID=613905 RepID=UPI0010FB1C5B|nr:transcription factor IIIB 60 kDa subunit-like [Nylanderia fulva]